MSKNLIITRHPAAVEFLESFGITGDVHLHATDDLVRGRRVYGVLPMNLACLTDEYYAIEMDMAADMRGKELTLGDMERMNARVVRYKVSSHGSMKRHQVEP